jgi:hypothetical protein
MVGDPGVVVASWQLSSGCTALLDPVYRGRGGARALRAPGVDHGGAPISRGGVRGLP